MEVETPIQEFFNGGHVLITGGTGFLGKVLVEKLIRECPGLSKIYLLIRCKKGKNEMTRLAELLEDPLFSKLSVNMPNFREKVQIVPGNCALDGLGLSDEDRDLILENVRIVIHGAATVRFDENLKIATAINVNGTREVIRLCRKIPNIKALVHISTAYSNCNQQFVEEKFYEPPSCSSRIFEMAAILTPEEMDKLTPALLESWPNSYTMTKALAEHLVKQEEGYLPVCVFRPAVVTSTYKEPMPGWIDNMYGPTGMAVGAGCGLIRVVLADPDLEANLVPVDITVNAIINAARQTHVDFSEGDTEVKIYNFESVMGNPIKWRDYMNILQKVGLEVPSERAIWYYSLTLTKHWHVAWLLSLFLHFLPAIVIDIFARIFGMQPQMIAAYQKVSKFTKALAYFSTRRYEFGNENVRRLIAVSDSRDRDLFNMDVKTVNWQEYLGSYIKGAREYLLKESWDTLPQARVKWNRFYWLHQGVKVLLTYGLLRLSYSVVSLILS